MNLAPFADVYAPAILQAAADLHPWTLLPAEEYALQAALALLTRIELYGVNSVNHYLLHRLAVPAACTALGIAPTARAIEDYLERS